MCSRLLMPSFSEVWIRQALHLETSVYNAVSVGKISHSEYCNSLKTTDMATAIIAYLLWRNYDIQTIRYKVASSQRGWIDLPITCNATMLPGFCLITVIIHCHGSSSKVCDVTEAGWVFSLCNVIFNGKSVFGAIRFNEYLFFSYINIKQIF